MFRPLSEPASYGLFTAGNLRISTVNGTLGAWHIWPEVAGMRFYFLLLVIQFFASPQAECSQESVYHEIYIFKKCNLTEIFHILIFQRWLIVYPQIIPALILSTGKSILR
jgi:hypothetical protein